ncbi:MAG: hypothetical protein UV93_C0011G0008 [Candidatus Azambacteria bacterium GW2011_GWC2_43_27]|uniref:Uncharacterized protein n=1 Tax=Candidatus Zambryskibacteria bacterium RIFOXYD2_FULL_43_10 TaxID=1802782 RepID=A0A1G2V8S3_9BACT|nr:MAG: hypothetical protein UV93_C0011G0008 [Candidatus Azambacteria bacterium GW2011_GWC2_43_27]OHB18029.1 MAG: hypothetical protein A2544_02715 [Candidatus Zambryskibacteria bacterium RIFOXYD2_FULL_43_10]
MLLESVTSSWAGHQNMEGFPFWPKTLPTKSSYKQDEIHQVTKTKCFRTVKWVRLWRRVGRNTSTGKHIWKWQDAYWLD